jgi:hypothetical protein
MVEWRGYSSVSRAMTACLDGWGSWRRQIICTSMGGASRSGCAAAGHRSGVVPVRRSIRTVRCATASNLTERRSSCCGSTAAATSRWAPSCRQACARPSGAAGCTPASALALAALIESGRYDRHLRRMRVIYAGRRACLVAALSRHAHGVRLTGLAAGFHAVAHLQASADERAVVTAARERLVGLYGMSKYRASGLGGAPQLVLGFGNVSERAIEPGIAAVADLIGG